jgi:hypothetical protein
MNSLFEPDKTETKEEDKLPKWQEDLCAHVISEWDKGKQYCSDLDDLYDDIYAMIRGERPEKNYDWQSNVVINKVFQIVWTAIPYISQKVFGAEPIIGLKSQDKKGAWQREQILEFWNTMQALPDKQFVPFFLVCIQWWLRALLNGVGILKKGWHQKLQSKSVKLHVPMSMDESGEAQTEEVEQRVTVPLEDWPHNRVVSNKDIVFDWLLQPGQSIRAGRFITERSVVDLDSLFSNSKYFNLEHITRDSRSTTEEEDHSEARSKDGQDSRPTSDIYTEVEVYERMGLIPVYKEKQDGKWIPCLKPDEEDAKFSVKEMIITVAKVGNVTTLIGIEPNKAGFKNYIDIHIYLDEERWQSMGMVEPIKDLQTALNDNINAVFDEIWQNLMPPVIVNKFALWDWDTMQYAPQQRWLVGGPPDQSIMFKEPSRVTGDAWQRHALFDNEIQITSAVNAPVQGMGKEKAATTNVLNAQMSVGKLDFIVKMIEITGLIPNAQMDILFAKKFAHPKTLEAIVGEKFLFGGQEEIYRYVPAASSVKLDQQKEVEIQQDIQLLQTIAPIQNPNTPKIMNILLGNIMRNRNMPQEAKLLDEDYFEPSSDAGNIQMLKRIMGKGNMASNEKGLPMSNEEKGVRQLTFDRGQNVG